MSDAQGTKEEAPKTETPPAAAAPKTALEKLQALEQEGRKLLEEARNEMFYLEKAAKEQLQNAQIAFDGFVHHFSLHLNNKKPK